MTVYPTGKENWVMINLHFTPHSYTSAFKFKSQISCNYSLHDETSAPPIQDNIVLILQPGNCAVLVKADTGTYLYLYLF